jgi:hypothetical protein
VSSLTATHVAVNPAQPPIAPTEAALLRRLRQEGFGQGAPPHVQEWSQKIDAGMIRRTICPQCRTRGLRYQPFHKGRQYKAVGLCCRCGEAVEF